VLSTEDVPSIDLDKLVARWDAIVALGAPSSLEFYKKIDDAAAATAQTVGGSFDLNVDADDMDGIFIDPAF
jgi:hypothetical protein